MADRYFSDVPIVGDRAVLSHSEAHHLIHVMRARQGDEVVLFDGSGVEFLARIERTTRNDVELAILERKDVDRELSGALVLGVSLPKGDRQKWLVEKAVELGVKRLVPLVTARSVAQPVEKALERLRRSVVEASKQCGRNRLMEIAEPLVWAEFVVSAKGTKRRWLAHPAGSDQAGVPAVRPSGARAGGCVLAVGPEGGFSDDEVTAALQAGWEWIDLGPRILRIETAALLLAGLAALGILD